MLFLIDDDQDIPEDIVKIYLWVAVIALAAIVLTLIF